MDVAKLLERFDSKKLRPLTAIVIVEIMLFLFSIETLIEWFNIHPIVFFLFFVMSSVLVFSILQYIKQSPEQKSWFKAVSQWLVFVRTIMAIIVFLLLLRFLQNVCHHALSHHACRQHQHPRPRLFYTVPTYLLIVHLQELDFLFVFFLTLAVCEGLDIAVCCLWI